MRYCILKYFIWKIENIKQKELRSQGLSIRACKWIIYFPVILWYKLTSILNLIGILLRFPKPLEEKCSSKSRTTEKPVTVTNRSRHDFQIIDQRYRRSHSTNERKYIIARFTWVKISRDTYRGVTGRRKHFGNLRKSLFQDHPQRHYEKVCSPFYWHPGWKVTNCACLASI